MVGQREIGKYDFGGKVSVIGEMKNISGSKGLKQNVCWSGSYIWDIVATHLLWRGQIRSVKYKKCLKIFLHTRYSSSSDVRGRHGASKQIDVCRTRHVKNIIFHSLGDEGYYLGVDTVLLA